MAGKTQSCANTGLGQPPSFRDPVVRLLLSRPGVAEAGLKSAGFSRSCFYQTVVWLSTNFRGKRLRRAAPGSAHCAVSGLAVDKIQAAS